MFLSKIKPATGLASVISRRMSSLTNYKYETLNVTQPKEFVYQVELNRPEKRNAQNFQMYNDITNCFKQISYDGDCRAVVLSGAGKLFCSGIDVMSLAENIRSDLEPGRRAFALRRFVYQVQESMSSLEKCPKPVIGAIHNACIGGGVDLISSCDIRYCSMDAYFQIKEVDLGLAADIGTLQRFPKIVGNDSLVRELAYTARKVYADEARQLGLVSRILQDREAVIEASVELAAEIASKSPVAVQSTKVNLIYSRDHSVAEGLEYVLTWNQGMLQSEDTVNAATAFLTKQAPVFSKL